MERSHFKVFSAIILTGLLLILPFQEAFAQPDFIIDLDGIKTPGVGGAGDQNVSPGDPLTAFPTGLPPVGSRGGIDWFDRDGSLTWTNGDDLHSEDPDTCPTSDRDGFHDDNAMFFDCEILDLDNNFPDGILVDCDLETGGSPSGIFPIPPPPCQDTRANVQITFFDENGDGFWNDGEDIILDFDDDGMFFPVSVVGGIKIPIDQTAVLIGGFQTISYWLVPIIVSAIGIGLFITRRTPE